MTTVQRQKLGSNVKEHRVRCGYSQRSLAQRIGTNQSLIWQIETGRISTGFDQICRLADAFGVKPSDLVDF